MGSFIEVNYILQITNDQGFPSELNLETHLKSPYPISKFENTVFSFQNKTKIRLYQLPPGIVFLVQNLNGKWVYWGQIEILSITHDYIDQTTSGSYRITKLFTPEEMRWAEQTIHNGESTKYFANLDSSQ